MLVMLYTKAQTLLVQFFVDLLQIFLWNISTTNWTSGVWASPCTYCAISWQLSVCVAECCQYRQMLCLVNTLDVQLCHCVQHDMVNLAWGRVTRSIGLANGTCRVKTSYLSKIADFMLPHLHLVPPLGVIPFKFRKDLWRQKTTKSLYYRVVLFEWSYQYRRATYTITHTDTDTQRRHIRRYHSIKRWKLCANSVRRVQGVSSTDGRQYTVSNGEHHESMSSAAMDWPWYAFLRVSVTLTYAWSCGGSVPSPPLPEMGTK